MCRARLLYAAPQHALVGYQNKALTCDGKNDFVVHTLRAVGTDGTEMTLGDFTATDNGDDLMWDYGIDYLYTLQQNGLVDQTYTFLCATYAADIDDSVVGWYKKEDADRSIFTEETCQNGVKLPYLQGFKVNASSDDMFLQNAGEVVSKGWIEIALTCDGKNDFTGNVTPVRIKLGDITATDDPDVDDIYWDYGIDYLYTLQQNGLVKQTYTFLCATYAADIDDSVVGWYKKEDADRSIFTEETCQNNKVSFDPGEAFKVNASSDDMCIYVPSALGTN